MSTNLLSPILQQINEYTLEFYCPGCKMMHCVYLKHPNNRQASWDWNMCSKSPTFSPSLLISGTARITDAERDTLMAGGTIDPRPYTCHFFIRDGQLQFLGDCTHDLKGKTLPMVDIPEDDL